jgi:hypothetical protein
MHMTWLKGHQRTWRVLGLIILVAALSGPWSFDVINVPLPFECPSPLVRLEGDFCGTPVSMAGQILGMVGGFPGMLVRLFSGQANLLEPLYALLFILLVLPLLSSMVLMVGEGPFGHRLAHLLVLGLANAGALFMAIQIFAMLSGYAGPADLEAGGQFYARTLGALWGLWIYIGVTDCLLVSEVLVLSAGRRA